jgi:hypothetical protein
MELVWTLIFWAIICPVNQLNMLMFSFFICFGVSVASSWTVPLHTLVRVYSVWGWLCVMWRSHDGKCIDFLLLGCDTVCNGSQRFGRRRYCSLKVEKVVSSEMSMYLCAELQDVTSASLLIVVKLCLLAFTLRISLLHIFFHKIVFFCSVPFQHLYPLAIFVLVRASLPFWTYIRNSTRPAVYTQ